MLVDHGKSINFSHRDLNDGNVMIKVNGPDDVNVWLIDFGKSMATVDKKEQVSAGMWLPPQNNERIFDYNPTTDTVRLITNITQSLIRSYAEKGVAPEGDVRAFLEANMPCGEHMTKWLAHLKEKMGDAEFDAMWDKDATSKNQSGNKDYLDFAAKPPFTMMREYYKLEDRCKALLPENIIADIDNVHV